MELSVTNRQSRIRSNSFSHQLMRVWQYLGGIKHDSIGQGWMLANLETGLEEAQKYTQESSTKEEASKAGMTMGHPM